MRFFCSACQRERSFDNDYGMMVIDAAWKVIRRYCRTCKSGKAHLPDVFWDGKPEENLADDTVTGKPRVFLSKGHKESYLRERGLREAGDTVHGAPATLHVEQSQKRDTRHEVKMAIKRVKELGIDVRRQQYLKIIKEGRNHSNA